MSGVVQLQIIPFTLVYVLLLAVLAVMKKAKIQKTKLLFIASLRMSLQLVFAGLVLTWIFENPHPLLTIAYVVAMVVFAIHRVLSKSRLLNPQFKLIIALSLAGCGTGIVVFFVLVVVRMNLFNPQYTIPISGMIIANSMTGLNLALKSFQDSLKDRRSEIETLLNLGVHPRRILLPLVNSALETALLPTLNSMLGMGIVALPGMMTGQILSGTLPMTAILYQIAIMIAICTAVALSSFCALNLGYQTLWNRQYQIRLK